MTSVDGHHMGMSEESFKAMLARGHQPVCFYCSCPLTCDNAVKEHTVPRSRGGKNGDNVVLACRRCDKAKGPLTAYEYLSVRHDEQARKALITLVAEQIQHGTDTHARRAIVLEAARVPKPVPERLAQTVRWPVLAEDGTLTWEAEEPPP